MTTHLQQQLNATTESQAQKPVKQKTTSNRGFAAMDSEKHKKVSAQGGRASQQQQQGARQAAQTQNAVSNPSHDELSSSPKQN